MYYRARVASSRRRAINQAKVVLRRAGHVLPREADVRRWLTPERLAVLPASGRVILLSTCRQITTLQAELDGASPPEVRGWAGFHRGNEGLYMNPFTSGRGIPT